jgi:phytoene synthase
VTSERPSPQPARDAELAHHYALCEAALREKDRDAWLSTLFAPAGQRKYLQAIHAFALEIAEIPCKVTQPLLGEMRLRWWGDALAAREEGASRAHPVLDALIDTCDACRLAPHEIEGFLDAHIADLYDDPLLSEAALLDYCERTAAQPLRWSARALGATGEAEALTEAGIAQGHLRILRRLPTGGAQFLPADLLARHGASREDAAAGVGTPELRTAIATLVERASPCFERARSAVREADEATRVALLPAATVPLYLQTMRSSDFQPFARPHEPSAWRRQWRLWRAARVGL